MASNYDEDGVWRTVGGRRIFIKDGQSVQDAMKKSGKFDNVRKKNQKEDKKESKEKNKNFTEKDENDIIKKDSEELTKYINDNVKELGSSKYEDGTYNINSKESVNFENGFQATFQQLGDKYSDKEFGDLVKKYSEMTDGKVYAGKFGGSPEISFHFDNEEDAIKICNEFNQVSYWDWKNMKEIKNKNYKKGKGNDYV